MHTAHIILSSLIALVFVIAGLAKASGNPRGLAVTRGVNIKDGLARVIGVIEALAALGIVIGLRNVFVEWIALVILWVLLTLVSIALVTI
jgi:uncharacterized membrane protein YphA (DoxX/SURF4 family)